MENSEFFKHLSQIASVLQVFGLQFFSIKSLVRISESRKIKNKLIYFSSFVMQFIAFMVIVYQWLKLIKQNFFIEKSQVMDSMTVERFLLLASVPLYGLQILLKIVEAFNSLNNMKMFKKFYRKSIMIQHQMDKDFQGGISLKKLRIFFIIKFVTFILVVMTLTMINTNKMKLEMHFILVVSVNTCAFKFKLFVDLTNKFFANLRDLVRKSVENVEQLHNNGSSKIEKFRSILSAIKETSLIVNEMSKLSILLIFIIHFIHVLIYGHCVILAIIHEKTKNEKIIVNSFIVIFVCHVIYKITESCQMSEKIKEELIFELHRLYSEHFATLRKSERLMISQMIKHLHNDPIEFSMAGFYTLNLKLFASVSYNFLNF